VDGHVEWILAEGLNSKVLGSAAVFCLGLVGSFFEDRFEGALTRVAVGHECVDALLLDSA
jgi:hypothetical protein